MTAPAPLRESRADETQGVTLVTLTRNGLPWIVRRVTYYLLSKTQLHETRRSVRRRPSGPSPGPLLEALNFIHFARWVLVGRRWWRRPSWSQKGESQTYSIVVFVSNFDSGWRSYVDAFMEASRQDLRVMFDTVGWVEPMKAGFERFLEFVNRHEVRHVHYYAAYPELSTAEVKSALLVDREVRSFAKNTSEGWEEQSDEQWRAEYMKLVSRVQRCLGRIDYDTETDLPREEQPDEIGDPVPVTILCPFPRDRLNDVCEAIRKHAGPNERTRTLGSPDGDGSSGRVRRNVYGKRLTMSQPEDSPVVGAASPFAKIPGTHFARLSVFDEVNKGEQRFALESGYLLFAADADGKHVRNKRKNLEEYLGKVWETMDEDSMRAIWGWCPGFAVDTKESFTRFMMKHAHQPTVPFVDRPRSSLRDVMRSLHTHRLFTEFVFRSSTRDAATLRKDFKEEVEIPMGTL